MKALITGVEGFVGKYLSEYLLEQGYEIYGTTIAENYKNDKINVIKILDLFDNLNFLFPQGVKTPCFRIFVLLNFRSFRTSLL